METKEISFKDAELREMQSHKESVHDNNTGEPVVKEIGSWAITFSTAENCVSLSTPALHPFSLKLEIEDLEEILEFAYIQTGSKKTLKKLSLSHDDISGLINVVRRIIEDKTSRTVYQFSPIELKEIANTIDLSLKVKR